MSESLFNKVAGGACNLLKVRLWHRSEFCEISKNIFFTKHLWVTASVRLRLAAIPLSLNHLSLNLSLVPAYWRFHLNLFYKHI